MLYQNPCFTERLSGSLVSKFWLFKSLFDYFMGASMTLNHPSGGSEITRISIVGDESTSGGTSSNTIASRQCSTNQKRKSRFKVFQPSPTDVAMTSMLLVSVVEIVMNVVWALTPFTFLQAMISTPCFAIINNIGVAYVSVRNFGPVREAAKQYKDMMFQRLSSTSTGAAPNP